MMKEVYNVPMNEMMEVIDHALMNDYSLAWASDVSEEGFHSVKEWLWYH